MGAFTILNGINRLYEYISVSYIQEGLQTDNETSKPDQKGITNIDGEYQYVSVERPLHPLIQ